VFEETDRLLRTFGAGRHIRPVSLASVRRACLATLIALVAQFGLGMWLNLYGQIPAADQHAGFAQEIQNGPAMLTVHALVGTFLIGAAIVLLSRTIRVRNGKMVVLASAGLGAILGAFAAGELFVRDGGESRASLSMAVLTGIALLSYVLLQALTSAARTGHVRQQHDDPAQFVPRLPQRPAATRPRPGVAAAPPTAAPAAAGWPNARRAAPMGPRQPGYQRAMPGQTPARWNPASVPRPAYPPATSGPQPAYPRAARPYVGPRNADQQQARPTNTRPWRPAPNSYYPGES
jgi:hypothetical protein